MLCPFGPSFMFTLGPKSISTFGNMQKIAICAILHVVYNLELMSGQKLDTDSFRDVEPQMLDLNPNSSLPKNFPCHISSSAVCLQIFLWPSV